jgi:hypothetical protein
MASHRTVAARVMRRAAPPFGTPQRNNRCHAIKEPDAMPTERTSNPRNDRALQQRSDLKQPVPAAHQLAHPLVVEGPEAVRDSRC